MRPLLLWAGLLCAGLGCEPSYLPTIAPKDAEFALACAPGCGTTGRDPGVAIDVTFVGHGRQYNVCCDDVPALRARLQTIVDYWCDGLDVPETQIGELTVGVTESLASKKRGATLNQGEGYVAFNCDDWLPGLVARLGEQTCCAAKGAAP